MTTRLTIELDDALTWGELTRFIDATRGQVSPVESVTYAYDSEGREIAGIEAEVTRLTNRPVVFSAESAAGWIDVISAIIEADGDAREALPRLQELRDGMLALDS